MKKAASGSSIRRGERCGHEWVPHDINKEPTVCPKCKNPYWNQPRKLPAKNAKS
jgi:predicted Zn-ribbon and HTH transcriptional regulator